MGNIIPIRLTFFAFHLIPLPHSALMTSVIEPLLILQERDTRLHSIQKELLHIPEEEKALDLKLQNTQASFELKKKTVLNLEAERKKIELEVSSKQLQIGKYKQQQLDTRKNEEFQALGNEIKHAEESIRTLDDQQLDLMEKIEVAQKNYQADQEILKKFTVDHQVTKNTLAQKKISLQKSLTEIQALRADAASKIEEPLLRKYQRILAAKKDLALVPVRGGVCGGCHVKVTSQTLVAAKSLTEPASCENCGRLIYLVE